MIPNPSKKAILKESPYVMRGFSMEPRSKKAPELQEMSLRRLEKRLTRLAKTLLRKIPETIKNKAIAARLSNDLEAIFIDQDPGTFLKRKYPIWTHYTSNPNDRDKFNYAPAHANKQPVNWDPKDPRYPLHPKNITVTIAWASAFEMLMSLIKQLRELKQDKRRHVIETLYPFSISQTLEGNDYNYSMVYALVTELSLKIQQAKAPELKEEKRPNSNADLRAPLLAQRERDKASELVWDEEPPVTQTHARRSAIGIEEEAPKKRGIFSRHKGKIFTALAGVGLILAGVFSGGAAWAAAAFIGGGIMISSAGGLALSQYGRDDVPTTPRARSSSSSPSVSQTRFRSSHADAFDKFGVKSFMPELPPAPVGKKKEVEREESKQTKTAKQTATGSNIPRRKF